MPPGCRPRRSRQDPLPFKPSHLIVSHNQLHTHTPACIFCTQAVGYNEAGEIIPLEPFNLMRERDEGYFDADGNYIEYRLEGLSDAWLEGLEDVSAL